MKRKYALGALLLMQVLVGCAIETLDEPLQECVIGTLKGGAESLFPGWSFYAGEYPMRLDCTADRSQACDMVEMVKGSIRVKWPELIKFTGPYKSITYMVEGPERELFVAEGWH